MCFLYKALFYQCNTTNAFDLIQQNCLNTTLNRIVDGHAADTCSQKTYTDNAILKGYKFYIAAISLYVWTYFLNGLLDFIYLCLHPIPSFSNG